MIFEYFFVGLLVGFIFYELTDVSPGGVIAPAYFALFIDDLQKIAVTLVLAIIVWKLLDLLARNLVLYGRRKLLLALIIGFSLKVAIQLWVQPNPLFTLDLQSIGYIIPGLIANEMSRQGFLPTISALSIVTVLIQLIILIIHAL